MRQGGNRKDIVKLLAGLTLLIAGLITVLMSAFRTDVLRSNLRSGNDLYDEGRFEAAIDRYQRTLESENPRILEKAYYNLGNCYLKLGRPSEAIGCYENALLLDPSDEDAKFNLEIALRLSATSAGSGGRMERKGREAVEVKPGGINLGTSYGETLAWDEMMRSDHSVESPSGPDW